MHILFNHVLNHCGKFKLREGGPILDTLNVSMYVKNYTVLHLTVPVNHQKVVSVLYILLIQVALAIS